MATRMTFSINPSVTSEASYRPATGRPGAIKKMHTDYDYINEYRRGEGERGGDSLMVIVVPSGKAAEKG